MEMKGEWMGVNSLLNKSRYISIIRRKTAKIVEKRKVAKESEENLCVAGGTAVHHPPRVVVGPTGNPWWGLSSPVRLLPLRCVLCSFGASTRAVGFAYVGSFWVSFASFLDPHGLLTSSNYMCLSL